MWYVSNLTWALNFSLRHQRLHIYCLTERMDSFREWLNRSLKDIDHEAFKDVVKVDVDLKPLGDEQVVIISDMNRATLKLETSLGGKRNMNVIVKQQPTSAGKALEGQHVIFENETMMYNIVLKSMEKLMSEKGDADLLWADCYCCKDNKFVLQDLCDIGFKIVPPYQFLDFEHTVLVMKGLGKFHGLSMVMKERNMLDTTKLLPNYLSLKSPIIINLHKKSVVNLARTIKESWGPEWTTAAENLKKLVANPGDTMCDMCDSLKDKWCVLNHGDFSIRNMLFHYPSDSTKPCNIKFVDFQTCHYSNFAFDLASLLYGSLRPHVREENKIYFLNTYLDSMKTTCESYGYRGQLPNIEDAKFCLEALSYYTTANAICNIPFFIASGKTDVQKLADNFVEGFVRNEVSEDEHTKQEDVLITDNETIEEMKYEVKRIIRENMI